MEATAHFVGKTQSAIALAGITLRWLVKFAEARRAVTYGVLAKQIGVNPRTMLPRILGVIGHSLESHSREIPPIQLLVINKKKKLPGRSGLLGFLIKDKALLERLSNEDQRHQWELATTKIFDWDWRRVLDDFGLPPLSLNDLALQSGDASLDEIEHQVEAFSGAGGEQKDHRRLKLYISTHPEAIGLNHMCSGSTERTILSGDRLDVFFQMPSTWVGIEVKGEHSSCADILRGLFQCVKYKAVLEAQRLCTEGPMLPSVRVALVLGSDLPAELEPIKVLLGVEVKERVVVPLTFVDGTQPGQEHFAHPSIPSDSGSTIIEMLVCDEEDVPYKAKEP